MEMKPIRRLFIFIGQVRKTFCRRPFLPHDPSFVGPWESLAVSWTIARDRTTDWAARDLDLQLAEGDAEPQNLIESWRGWRARRSLHRRARSLARCETWFALCARAGHRKHRLDQLIAMTEQGEVPLDIIVRERWLCAEADQACEIRYQYETAMKTRKKMNNAD
jgi:hypothetical protein